MKATAPSQATPIVVQRKILLTFALSSLIGVVLVAGFLWRILQKRTLAEVRKAQESAALLMAQRFDSEIADAQAELQFVAQLPAFAQLPDVDRIDPSLHGVPENVEVEKRELLRRLNQKAQRFSALYVLQTNADMYLVHPFAVQRTLIKDNLADRPYFQEAARTKRAVISDSFVGASGVSSVAILVPVLDGAGNVTAYIGGAFYLTHLTQLLAKERLKPFDSSFLVDRNGDLIAHTHTELLREGVRERFRTHQLVAEFLKTRKTTAAEGVPELTAGECVDPVDGKSYLTAFVPTRVGWGFGLARSKAAVLAEVRPLVWSIAGLAAFLLLVVSGLGVLFAQRLGRSWEAADRERQRAEETLRQNARELRVRNRIAEVFLTVPDEEMYAQVLAIVLEATDSRFGVFGHLDEHGALVVPTMTRTVWDKCQVPDKRFVFPRETWGESSWPRAIREKRTICLNGLSTLTPPGHIQITRHISLPLIHQGEVVGLIQVANKETDYSPEDVALLETIGGAIAPVLDARLKRERQQDKLKRALADLARSNRELEQFAYVASHDLQEPLRMVSSYTQLLADRYEEKLDDKARKYIAYAVDGAIRMQRLIGDLLTYSRVGTRGGPPAPTDAHAALGEALGNLAAAIAENHAIITNDDLPTVRADASQLVQVFQNLLGNAIKFHGPELPCIHVSAKAEDDEWVFSVKDNGIGIDPQYKEKMFVIFQRLHTRQEYAGTGIGLALCRRIIERHGGRIWFESAPGKGATFSFTLPK